jgi:hypothetical protein
MLGRRKSDRARTFFGAMIAFNKRNSTIDCQVRDFSSMGARVHLTNTAVIRDQFDLTISRKVRSFRARMVWRSVDEAGVAFLGEYNNEMPVSLDLAGGLRQNEPEKAILRKRIAQLTDNGAT